MKIILTGQALLQSDIRERWPDTIANMRPLLSGDVVFTNFESMIVDPEQVADLPSDNTGHQGPPEMLDVLREMGFNLLALANNHSYDLRETGISRLIGESEARGFTHAGVGMVLDQAATPAYLDTPEGRVALVAMATGATPEGAAATSSKPGVNIVDLVDAVAGIDAGRPADEDAHRVMSSIKVARQNADIVIAYHHNHSYDKDFVKLISERPQERLEPPKWAKIWAHQQIEAGADIVVFHGLPLVQGLEIHDGRPIFYNLGNFMFQLNVAWLYLFEPDVFKSVVAEVEFDEQRRLHSIVFRPIVLDDRPWVQGGIMAGMPKPASGLLAQTILAQLAELSKAFGTDMTINDGIAKVNLSDSSCSAALS